MDRLVAIVVDDQPIRRDATERALTSSLGPATSVGALSELNTSCELHSASLAVLAPAVLQGRVIDALEQLSAVVPAAAVVLFPFTEADTETAAAAVRSGARGIVASTATANELIACLVHVTAGGASALPPTVTALVLGKAEHGDALSPRERYILELVAGGLTNDEIAGICVIGLSTVKTHLTRIYRKLGARGRVDAIEKGMFRGEIAPRRGVCDVPPAAGRDADPRFERTVVR